MEYRRIPGSNDRMSTIGIGTGHLHELSLAETKSLVDYALDKGVNVIDSAASYAKSLEMLGEALRGRRSEVYHQVHLGLVFPEGQYGRSRNLDAVKAGFHDNLKRLGN